MIKTIPKKNKCKKAKWLSEEALQIATIPKKNKSKKGKMVVWGGLTKSCEKKASERQRRKGKINPSECRVPKNSKER